MPRHFFPGGNTPEGFRDFFGSIAWDGERRVHLKGASGCGKSTFMRRVATEAEARGLDVEYFHCSNDAESLDGIRVPGASLCIVDGTAPHVSDPAVPVARDRLFNMAEFIDPGAVSPHRDEIERLMLQKKQGYSKAYHCLAAARSVLRNNDFIYGQFLNEAKLNAAILETLSMLGKSQCGRSRHRKLFASAVTPGGYVNFIDSLAGENTVYILRGEAGAERLLEQLREAAALRGFDSEGLYCPMNPAKLEHLIIPEMGLLFTTANRYHAVQAPGREIDFASFYRRGIAQHWEELEENHAMFDALVGMAVRTLAAQRAAHDRIEEIYIAGMDFAALNAACEGMIASFYN